MLTRVKATLSPGEIGGRLTLLEMIATAATAQPASAVSSALRVLVVDGNSVNQRLWSHMLKRLGYRSLSVGDGWEAIDALAMFPSEIILMDLDLPEGAGFEAALHIREKARDPGRPWIVGITINPQPEDYDRAMRVGMNDFLIKSGHPENLMRAMQFARKSLGLKEDSLSHAT